MMFFLTMYGYIGLAVTALFFWIAADEVRYMLDTETSSDKERCFIYVVACIISVITWPWMIMSLFKGKL